MRKTIISLIMTIFCLSTSFAFNIPSSPNPVKLVNDYIGLLQPDQIKALESKLVDFNNKTSIQITVVVLDDLDGAEASDVATEIGHQWGVGQKGIDNGIVFLIVKYNQNALEKLVTQKHGDWQIAVGYGLEPYMTTRDAKSIGESKFIPYAKQDEYYEGVNQTIDAIIKDLGEIGWQQREELRAKKKAEAAESMRKFGNGLLNFFICVAILALLIFLFVKIRRDRLKAQEINQRRDSLKKSFYEAKAEFENLLIRIPNDISSYPSWAIELYDKIVNNIERASKAPAKSVIDEFPVIVESNMVRASNILSILTGCVHGLGKSITELEAIPNKIKEYSDDAPIKLKAAEDAFQIFATSIQVLKDKGFKLALYEKELGNFKESLSKTKAKVNIQEDKNKDICLESIGIREGIEGTIQLMNTHLHNRESVSQIVANLNTQIKSLSTQKESTQKVLDQIKVENPKQNWEDLEKAFGSVTGLFSLCTAKKDEAEKKNTMDVQDFDNAKVLADEANEKMQKILNIFHAISNRKDDIINAKQNFDSTLRSAEKSITDAKNKCSDSDVKSGAKKKLVEAQNKTKEAQSKVSENMTDWLMVITLLISAKSLANEAYSLAKRDIEKAEEERNEAVAAAAKAAAATAAALVASRNTYNDQSYNSPSYSSPSYNNDGGSSISFGGGDFGGGGAGGSW